MKLWGGMVVWICRPAIRDRLIVLSPLLVALAISAFLLRGSVHFGPPPPYDPPPLPAVYDGQVITWEPGKAGLVGWVQNRDGLDCADLVAWITTDRRKGYVGLGPVGRNQRVIWAGWLREGNGQLMAMGSAPAVTFECYRS